PTERMSTLPPQAASEGTANDTVTGALAFTPSAGTLIAGFSTTRLLTASGCPSGANTQTAEPEPAWASPQGRLKEPLAPSAAIRPMVALAPASRSAVLYW